jgi:hypothetical protein
MSAINTQYNCASSIVAEDYLSQTIKAMQALQNLKIL